MKRKDLFTSFFALWKRFFRKQPKRKVTYVYSHSPYPYQITGREIYKPDQEEIDALLDKILEKGYDKLTKAEKQKLLDASHSI